MICVQISVFWYSLISSKLVKFLGFKGIYPFLLPLPLDQNQN